MEEQLQREQRRRDTRRILWQWGDTLAYCRRKQSEAREYTRLIDDAAYTLGAQKLDGMPHAHGASSEGMLRAVEMMQRSRELYEQACKSALADVEKALAMKAKIDELIDELPPIQQRVLHLRYEGGHKYDFICMKLCYRESQVKHYEAMAIDELSKYIHTN